MQFRKYRAAIFAALLFLLCAGTTGYAASATQDYWQDVPARPLPAGVSAPTAYRLLDLDANGLKARIAQGETKLALPTPSGGFIEVTLEDSGTMPAELAAKFPEIRSFRGTDSDGTHVRVDISPLGVNAMVFAKSGIWMVRPIVFGETRDYISFNRADIAAMRDPFQCEVHDVDPMHPALPDEIQTTTGTTKRNYRAAVAANHNYVQAISAGNPPTVAIGLAGVIAAVNRVNEVYENNLSIHLTLVANNDLLIFPSAGTDPYSNGTGALSQNTGIINGLIGNANYDIGHVFTTGSGGVAGLGVVCNNSQKGRGTTGLSNPASLQSDTFYIDFVAHEMGHQFGGNHTFNNSCSGNREASAAYEPGSGSTIMGYAGVCPVDLQPHSDPYFHAKSLQEISTFTAGSGGACSVTAVNNTSPVIAPLSGYTIPASTPFALTGSASTSAPGATLKYGFEQYDLGAATVNLNVDPGNGPIIRSLNPTVSPIRTVPKFTNLLSGATMLGEILPSTTRALNFRLTVFDNVLGGGTTESRDLTLQVSSAAGPFAVTAPATGATWNYGTGTTTQTVTWNVAGTTSAPVSCANVDIDVYSSGGFESSLVTLAQGVPNSGSAIVNVPNVATTTGRVRVRCSNNIFFAMSPGNFTILGSDLIFADGFEFGFIPSNPPTIAKAFSPTSVNTGVSSTLTITLANNNATAATLTSALTDTFPANLVIAPAPNASTTCSGGALSASAGAGSVSLSSGAQIPASGACTISVDVQSASANSYANTIAAGALQTDNGNNVASANATLTVNAIVVSPPTVTKAFAPTSVGTGASSTLTITLTNPAATVSTLSSALTDTFPSGLVVAASANASTTCAAGSVTAAAGSVSLNAGATIPATGSCTVSVDVTSATPATYANTIAAGALATDTGTNAGAANASLTVTAPAFDAPTVGVAFSPATVAAGTPSTLTITLANTNATIGTLSNNLIDYLPAGLQVAPTPNASTTCVGGLVTAPVGASTVSLSSGAQIPVTGSCTVAVDIRGVSAGMPNNTVAAGDLETSVGNNALPASAVLEITAGTFPAPYCARAFGTSVEPITLVNIGSINNTTTEVTGSAASPALEDFTGLSTSVRPGQSYPITFKGNSDGGYTDPFRVYVDWNQDGVFAENETEYSTGGAIFGSTGVDSVVTGSQLIVPISAKPGATRMRVIKVNSTGPTACTTTAAASYGQGEDYTLIVDYSLPTAAQRFVPGNILPGGTSKLSVTLVNQNTASTAVLSGDFVNPLPAGLLIAPTPNASTTCSSGTVSATAGSGTFLLTAGAQIPRGGSCTVNVDVTAAVAGGFVKAIADSALQTSIGNNASTASAQLNVDTPPADTTRLFANNTTDANAALLAGPTTTVNVAGTNTRFTPMVCGRVTLSQPGEQLITSFSTALANNSATAVTSSTTTAITFWDDTGTGGGPGVRLSAVNGLYPGYSNGYFGYGVAIPANGKILLNAAPFGYRAIRVPAPANGGRARVWSCVHFSSSTVADAILSNLGVEKFVNSPTFGATEDLAFVSNLGGPTTVDNPTGTLVSNSGGTENVFGWQLFTAGQAPVLDTVEGANAAGVAAAITQALTGQTGVAKNFQGYAANLPIAGDKLSLSGTANWSINGAILAPICTVVGNYTGIRANLKFWGAFNGTGAADVFGSPIATRTVDLGSFNCTTANSILNGIPVRFSSPVVASGGSQLGITVQFSSDTGAGFTENGEFTSAVSVPAAASTPAVGTNASVNGWYRSFTNRVDLNFTGTTASDYVSTTRAGINIRLYGERVQ